MHRKIQSSSSGADPLEDIPSVPLTGWELIVDSSSKHVDKIPKVTHGKCKKTSIVNSITSLFTKVFCTRTWQTVSEEVVTVKRFFRYKEDLLHGLLDSYIRSQQPLQV